MAALDGASKAATVGLPRRAALALLGGTALLATGCATLQQLAVQVQLYGRWPTGRAPGSYAFDRLPSQQAQPEAQRLIEAAAGQALAAAGFQPAGDGQMPDVLVQVGARVGLAEPALWHDPLWWRGGVGVWQVRPWRGSLWYARTPLDAPRFAREVALLIRDRASGQPLYEVRASSEGFSDDAAALVGPMFKAALQAFPATEPAVRTVHVAY